ncbi:NERD domain-containing protein [Cronbergia sp. UHCC 0137]|uniref:nuclease-related domain-containing protein n=1 Tax=Cronbergia sp. UHCC 0137 TaxID=3110239 RepID=UPI002B1F8AB3|nr:NERD domain-containing protein [Cronbergia sp. UHCC 0137]MEA5620410.1 NERD domain-containing protein [Cronbergia sp. UHCC 0137]
MPKSSRQAGQNIRELADKRRLKAIGSFVSAGLIIFCPFFLVKAFENFLKPISSVNRSQQQFSLNLPPILYVFLVIIALGLIVKGISLWKLANRADQGAKGEEDTAQVMSELQQEGWQIEYGMRLGNKLGDADIICISPQNKAYVIDVKSHRGEVTTDGKQLYRRMGKTSDPFEKDFLAQSMKQALQVKKQKNLSFVTPIVAFSDAKVSVPSGKVQKVYVVEKAKLISLLKSLG